MSITLGIKKLANAIPLVKKEDWKHLLAEFAINVIQLNWSIISEYAIAQKEPTRIKVNA
jgi:hypothetical protein